MFNPSADTFQASSLIDLRFLNEKYAGEHGVIGAKGGHFVHSQTGKAVRFWAVNGPFSKTREDLQRTLDRLLQAKLDDRKRIVGLKPQRADILPAGIIILDSALEILGKDRAIATTADLLLGVLLEERDAAGGRLTDERRPDTRAHRRFS